MLINIHYLFCSCTIQALKYFLNLFFVITIIEAQARIGDFRSISSFANTSNLVFTDSLLVGVSESGLVYFNSMNESVETVSIDEGLAFGGLSHIHIDKKNNFWIGSKKGIQVWDHRKKQLIAQFGLNVEAVSGFINYENFIYSAAKINGIWGIIEFRYVNNKIYFRDFYQRSDLKNILKISLFNDDIFISSSDGIISGNPFKQHISTWSNKFEGIEGPIIDLQGDNEGLYILSSSAIHRLSRESSLITIKNSLDLPHLKGLVIFNKNIYAYSNTSIFHIEDNEDLLLYTDQNLHINAVVKGHKFLWLATNFGIGRYGDNNFNSLIHNQPILNNPDILELHNNILIIANKNGIAIEGWLNYTTLIPPKINSSNFKISTLNYDLGEKITKSLMREDLLFLSFINSQTAGIVSLDLTNDQLPLVSKYNPYINQNSSNSSYSFNDMVFDKQNNLWALSSDNLNYPLSVFSKSQFKHFPSTSLQNNTIDGNKSVVVDNYNRIWMSSTTGLLMYNYSGDVLNPQSEEWVNVPVIDGINRRALNYAVSKDNTLWVITNYGLIYKKLRAQDDQPVIETGPLSSSGNITPFFQNIPFDKDSKIYFDPNENLWITSNLSGVYVLDSKNEYWPSINGINSSNSNLLSNKISDIKFNSKEGIVYIATDLGVSKFKIPFKNEIKKTNAITIFPSPFRIPSIRPMIIDGLPQGSSVQIISLNGNDIKTLDQNQINEYQAAWNGMNGKGVYVESGVYLILIINKKHGISTIKKIAVIKN